MTWQTRRRRPATRAEARQFIVDTANRGAVFKRYRMRHLHSAVARVRRNRLVPGEVLELAGFRAVGDSRRGRRS